MASLRDVVLDAFGSRRFELGLTRNGEEISPVGYARRPVSKWAVADETLSAEGLWGPFPHGATFDAIGVFVDGELKEALPLDGELRLLPHMVFAGTAEVAVF
jgi:hypothetical protein